MSLETWEKRIRRAERRGEFLEAYDMAMQAIERWPDAPAFQYHAVLSLARVGSTRQAETLYAKFGLDRFDDEDMSALGARIKKDHALGAQGTARAQMFTDSGEAYAAAFQVSGGYFPAINAASMFLLADEQAQARRWAQRAFALCRDGGKAGRVERYYRAATEAEAALILGDLNQVRDALGRAARLSRRDYDMIATTRRQLAMVCEQLKIDPAILDTLSLPAVVHYLGHMIGAPGSAGRFPAVRERSVARDIAELFDAGDVGFAYGSLACGADILFAEAALAHGAELHVVLPFDRDEFKETSVAVAGSNWDKRFDACFERAASVTFATDDSYLGDDSLFAYGSYLAMGMALLRARILGAPVCQFAVWDEGSAGGEGGSADDIGHWRKLGLTSRVISLASGGGAAPTRRAAPKPSVSAPRAADRRPKRAVRSILFGDIKGFSKLRDVDVPAFMDAVMAPIGDVLKRHAGHVVYRNSWGDAVYLVLDDVEAAARCALDIQRAIDPDALSTHGLPSSLTLRLAGHLGPVFEGYDFIRDEPQYFGVHVTRAARIEPVTPPGQVYVTEPFAAALQMVDAGAFRCEYVGRLPSAKSFGEFRMYSLVERKGAN